METFLQRLHSGEILLLDGAMGSLLTQRGVDNTAGDPNLLHAQAIQEVHRLYIEAGSDCIISNSFSLNGIYAAKHKRLAQLDDALKAAVENALQAADGHAYVLGDMGPGGALLEPYGEGDPNAYYEAFCHQAEGFAAYPIAAIIIETVFQWPETELMLKACREAAPKLPVLCSMTFARADKGGRTIMGDKAADIAEKAKELGAAAVGGNCGDLSVPEWATVLAEMQPAGLPLMVQPNAGKPEVVQEQVHYHLSPQDYAQQMLLCRSAGAQLLGGCCGTTPAHIRALRQELERQ